LQASPQPQENAFDAVLATRGVAPPRRRAATTLQLNIGLRCNLACHHCHVESGPKRSEAMGRAGAERILWLLRRNPGVEVLDITGGAPELHEHFRLLVQGARALGRRVIDRCNLTVLFEPGQEDTAAFLAAHEVEIVASLPCYTRENVEAQRGRGVFSGSIEALQLLNTLGYGIPGSRLRLDLVYNPGGAFLPPDPSQLEDRYRRELRTASGIEFHRLITITNMPIKRFAHDLARSGGTAAYQQLLEESFNPRTVDGLMCRSLVSVDHAGRLYDCDFNQALGIAVPGAERTIWDVDDLSVFTDREIATASHCLGCTAGIGSSCGGALVAAKEKA
jgi:radical SAM/Cys-rich protein